MKAYSEMTNEELFKALNITKEELNESVEEFWNNQFDNSEFDCIDYISHNLESLN